MDRLAGPAAESGIVDGSLGRPSFVHRQTKEKASRRTMTVIAHGCANWNSGVLVREIGYSPKVAVVLLKSNSK